MRKSIEVFGPKSQPEGRARDAERRREAATLTHQLIVCMIEAGWRETEAALALADAMDDHCLYIAKKTAAPGAANLNVPPADTG